MSEHEFLDSVPNKYTKRQYAWGLKQFVAWYGKGTEEILSLRRDDLTPKPSENPIDFRRRSKRFERELEAFHKHMIEKDYATNTVKTTTHGLRQLFRYYEMRMQIRHGSVLNHVEDSTKSFPLEITHVRAMFDISDLRERTYLSLATDLGLRITDFINLKKSDLPDLSGEPPLQLQLMTNKNKIVSKGFLSIESVELLKKYLPTLDAESLYLFPSVENHDSHISDDSVNSWLKELADKAHIELQGKTLSHHCFRKMFLSASVDCGIGLTVGKLLCGKQIVKSDDTYLTTVKLRQHFITLKKLLSIQQVEDKGSHELENAIRQLESENRSLKTRLSLMDERNKTLEDRLEQAEKKDESMEGRLVQLQQEYHDMHSALLKVSESFAQGKPELKGITKSQTWL